jgi:hypothetical protein
VQRYARQEYDQSGHPIYSFHLDVIHFAIAPGYGVDKKSLTNEKVFISIPPKKILTF